LIVGSRQPPRRVPGLSLVLAATLTVAACSPSVTPPSADARLTTCPIGRVLASFAIARARDYQAAIPRMGRSPELETDAPALVVIYDGPVDVGGRATDGVVCVVVGVSPMVYTEVDVTGWSVPSSPP
jgi:hypothetical protein